MIYSREQEQQLLNLAKDAILAVFEHRAPRMCEDEAFKQRSGLFVSLHINGELRGCIGYIHAYKSIAQSVVEMAVAAAFEDPRFPALKPEELDELKIEISILSSMIQVDEIGEILVGRDGLLLKHPHGSGLLLPQVATEYGWDKDEFLRHLCAKAGLHQGAFKDADARLFRFEAQVFD